MEARKFEASFYVGGPSSMRVRYEIFEARTIQDAWRAANGSASEDALIGVTEILNDDDGSA